MSASKHQNVIKELQKEIFKLKNMDNPERLSGEKRVDSAKRRFSQAKTLGDKLRVVNRIASGNN